MPWCTLQQYTVTIRTVADHDMYPNDMYVGRDTP